MSQMILAGVIFLVSLAAIMTEKVNRTTAAISGMVPVSYTHLTLPTICSV